MSNQMTTTALQSNDECVIINTYNDQIKMAALPSQFQYFVVSDTEIQSTISNAQEAEIFVQNYSLSSCTEWRVLRTYTRLSSNLVYKRAWRCQHNVQQKGKRVKDLNKQKVSKDFRCPGHICISVYNASADAAVRKVNLKDGFTSLIKLNTKHNHFLSTPEIRQFRTLDVDITTKMKNLFRYGHGASSAIRLHMLDLLVLNEHLYSDLRHDRKYSPSVSQIQHYLNHWKKETDNEHLSMDAIVMDYLINNKEAEVRYCPAFRKTSNQYITVMTPFMLMVHEKVARSSEAISILFSPKISRLGIRFILISTCCTLGPLPLGIIVTQQDDSLEDKPLKTEFLMEALEQFRQSLPKEKCFYGKVYPKVILTDQILEPIVSQVWTKSIVILSQDSLAKQVWTWLKESPNTQHFLEREVLFLRFKEIMFSLSADEFREKLNNLKLDASSHACYLKFIEKLLYSRHLWVSYLVQEKLATPNVNVTLHDPTEQLEILAMFVWKQLVFSVKHLFHHLHQVFGFLINHVESYYYVRIAKFCHDLVPDSMLSKYLDMDLKFDYRVEPSSVDSSCFYVVDPSSHYHCVESKFHLCSCQGKSPCEHVLAVARYVYQCKEYILLNEEARDLAQQLLNDCFADLNITRNTIVLTDTFLNVYYKEDSLDEVKQLKVSCDEEIETNDIAYSKMPMDMSHSQIFDDDSHIDVQNSNDLSMDVEVTEIQSLLPFSESFLDGQNTQNCTEVSTDKSHSENCNTSDESQIQTCNESAKHLIHNESQFDVSKFENVTLVDTEVSSYEKLCVDDNIVAASSTGVTRMSRQSTEPRTTERTFVISKKYKCDVGMFTVVQHIPSSCLVNFNKTSSTTNTDNISNDELSTSSKEILLKFSSLHQRDAKLGKQLAKALSGKRKLEHLAEPVENVKKIRMESGSKIIEQGIEKSEKELKENISKNTNKLEFLKKLNVKQSETLQKFKKQVIENSKKNEEEVENTKKVQQEPIENSKQVIKQAENIKEMVKPSQNTWKTQKHLIENTKQEDSISKTMKKIVNEEIVENKKKDYSTNLQIKHLEKIKEELQSKNIRAMIEPLDKTKTTEKQDVKNASEVVETIEKNQVVNTEKIMDPVQNEQKIKKRNEDANNGISSEENVNKNKDQFKENAKQIAEKVEITKNSKKHVENLRQMIKPVQQSLINSKEQIVENLRKMMEPVQNPMKIVENIKPVVKEIENSNKIIQPVQSVRNSLNKLVEHEKQIEKQIDNSKKSWQLSMENSKHEIESLENLEEDMENVLKTDDSNTPEKLLKYKPLSITISPIHIEYGLQNGGFTSSKNDVVSRKGISEVEVENKFKNISEQILNDPNKNRLVMQRMIEMYEKHLKK